MMLHLCDTQWPNSGLFLQNALAEYIGVYSDTNYQNCYCSILRKLKIYLFGWSFERKTYTWWSPKSSHSWFHEIWRILCGFHMKSSRFHEIWQISCEIRQISCGFHMKSGRFHETHKKSARFHVKSTWKPYKSKNSRKTLQFHGVQWEGYVMISHEIRRISCEICPISKDHLPGMVISMFRNVTFNSHSIFKSPNMTLS